MSFNIRCHLAIVVLASLLGWVRTLEAKVQFGQSAPPIVPYVRDPIELPDKIEILQKLRDHRYAELGSLLSSLQEKHERGEIKEVVVAVAYFSFSNSDPALETDLNQWVEQAPTTYAPWLARGTYYKHLGFIARGNAFASETAAKQLRRMNGYFVKAQADLLKALSIDNKLSVAWGNLINIAMAHGDKHDLKTLSQEALAIAPFSFVIRATYLDALRPKWGGSIEEMADFAQETLTQAKKVPELTWLGGYPDLARAKALCMDGKHREALLYLNRAMAYGNHARYFSDRGDIYLRLKEYDKAIADLTQSLDLTPQDTQALEARGSAYYRNGQLAQALADLDLAVKLDALDPDLLDLRSQILRKMGRTHEAVTDLQNALRFDTYNADLWYRKGWFLTNELQNHKDAAKDLERATKINPNYARYWITYAGTLNELRDCQVIPALEQYLKLCDAGQQCEEALLQWARQALPVASRLPTCLVTSTSK